MDPTDPKSYLQMSNLILVSKVIEALAANKFNVHTGPFNLLTARQPAYRQLHSTETAVTVVHNDIVPAIASKQLSLPALLDLSSAFETVDHSILLDVRHGRFDTHDTVYNWLHSYLTDRTQVFCTSSSIPDAVRLDCCVPQGSVVVLQKFSAYKEHIEKTIASNNVGTTFMLTSPSYRNTHIQETLSYRRMYIYIR